MDNCCSRSIEDESSNRKIIMHPLYIPSSLPWFDVKVFYVRVSNFQVDDFTPACLTVNHIPLTSDTILEVNGRRSSICSDYVSSSLRRDRVDKKLEEATFVSTNNIRMTGSMRFEVFNGDDILLHGVLEHCNGNGSIGEGKFYSKNWSMKCQSVVSIEAGFLKGKQQTSTQFHLPMLDVYVAGCFCGSPIILTKTLPLSFKKKEHMKLLLGSIPENETVEAKEPPPKSVSPQLSPDGNYRPDSYDGIDYHSMYSREEYLDREDGELSWFNAGVRVGIGIGLGIFLGIGVGVGLLVHTYQKPTRNIKRWLI